MDVLWFRLPKKASDPGETMGRFTAGRIVILIVAVMATHDGIKNRMHLVGRLDASDLRLSPGVPGLEIVDGGVRVDRGGACDQLGDDLTQLGQLRRSEQVGDHNEPITLICVPQGIAGHVFSPPPCAGDLAYGWRSRGAIVAL